MGSLSIWHWLIVLLVVVMVFGTKKLKNIGADLGGAVKGFKDGMKDGTTPPDDTTATTTPSTVQVARSAASDPSTIDVQAKHKS